jgi:hypothetical protein
MDGPGSDFVDQVRDWYGRALDALPSEHATLVATAFARLAKELSTQTRRTLNGQPITESVPGPFPRPRTTAVDTVGSDEVRGNSRKWWWTGLPPV